MYHGGLLSGGGGGGVEGGCFQAFEVAHLELSIGTPIADGTVVEKHCSTACLPIASVMTAIMYLGVQALAWNEAIQAPGESSP